MKITLACPSKWYGEDWGDADQTVDVPDNRAQELVKDGLARHPDSVAHLSGVELERVAADEGVDLSGAGTVTEKRDRVKAARTEKES